MWFEIGGFFGQQNLTVEKLGLVLTFFQQKKEQFLTHCIKEDKSHLIKYPLQTEALCLNYNYKYIVRHLSVKHVSFTTQQTVNRHCIIMVATYTVEHEVLCYKKGESQHSIYLL